MLSYKRQRETWNKARENEGHGRDMCKQIEGEEREIYRERERAKGERERERERESLTISTCANKYVI